MAADAEPDADVLAALAVEVATVPVAVGALALDERSARREPDGRPARDGRGERRGLGHAEARARRDQPVPARGHCRRLAPAQRLRVPRLQERFAVRVRVRLSLLTAH